MSKGTSDLITVRKEEVENIIFDKSENYLIESYMLLHKVYERHLYGLKDLIVCKKIKVDGHNIFSLNWLDYEEDIVFGFDIEDEEELFSDEIISQLNWALKALFQTKQKGKLSEGINAE